MRDKAPNTMDNIIHTPTISARSVDCNKEKPVISEVVAVGPGDKETEMVVKAGDKVVVGKYTGTEIKLDGKGYTIVKQSDILAIVE